MPATTTRLAAQDEKRHAQLSTERKPTARQIYAAAHLMADALGITWPANRKEASAVIARLRDLAAAHDATPQAPQDIPF